MLFIAELTTKYGKKRTSVNMLLKRAIFLFIFSCAAVFGYGQTREDTIARLTHMSKQYLDALFNKPAIDTAVSYWTDHMYETLKMGYNIGRIPYETNEDLLSLFSKDMKTYRQTIKMPVSFIQSDSASSFEDERGYKYFIIDFELDKSSDSTLLSASLVLISEDHGKSWKINQDFWLANFMHFLYSPIRPEN